MSGSSGGGGGSNCSSQQAGPSNSQQEQRRSSSTDSAQRQRQQKPILTTTNHPLSGSYEKQQQQGHIPSTTTAHSRPYNVDYFSHPWNELDLKSSWSLITRMKNNNQRQLNESFGSTVTEQEVVIRQRTNGRRKSRRRSNSATQRSTVLQDRKYADSIRLENATWRKWMQTKFKLARIRPDSEYVRWKKDEDITWLYGPFVQQQTGTLGMDDGAERDQEVLTPGLDEGHSRDSSDMFRDQLGRRQRRQSASQVVVTADSPSQQLQPLQSNHDSSQTLPLGTQLPHSLSIVQPLVHPQVAQMKKSALKKGSVRGLVNDLRKFQVDNNAKLTRKFGSRACDATDSVDSGQQVHDNLQQLMIKSRSEGDFAVAAGSSLKMLADTTSPQQTPMAAADDEFTNAYIQQQFTYPSAGNYGRPRLTFNNEVQVVEYDDSYRAANFSTVGQSLSRQQSRAPSISSVNFQAPPQPEVVLGDTDTHAVALAPTLQEGAGDDADEEDNQSLLGGIVAAASWLANVLYDAAKPTKQARQQTMSI